MTFRLAFSPDVISRLVSALLFGSGCVAPGMLHAEAAHSIGSNTVLAKKKAIHKAEAGTRPKTSSPSATDLNSPAINFSGVEPLVGDPGEQQLSPRKGKRSYFDQAPR